MARSYFDYVITQKQLQLLDMFIRLHLKRYKQGVAECLVPWVITSKRVFGKKSLNRYIYIINNELMR